MFPGYADRLKHELDRELPNGTVCNVLCQEDLRHKVWEGASIHSGMPVFEDKWFTRAMWDAEGTAGIWRRMP